MVKDYAFQKKNIFWKKNNQNIQKNNRKNFRISTQHKSVFMKNSERRCWAAQRGALSPPWSLFALIYIIVKIFNDSNS